MSARLVPVRDPLQAVMQAYGQPFSTHAYFTPDTYVNRYTSSCARLAAGGCAVHCNFEIQRTLAPVLSSHEAQSSATQWQRLSQQLLGP